MKSMGVKMSSLALFTILGLMFLSIVMLVCIKYVMKVQMKRERENALLQDVKTNNIKHEKDPEDCNLSENK
jgi:hypothetical protein